MTPGTLPERRKRRVAREPSGSRAVRESFVESDMIWKVAAGRVKRRDERPTMVANVLCARPAAGIHKGNVPRRGAARDLPSPPSCGPGTRRRAVPYVTAL